MEDQTSIKIRQKDLSQQSIECDYDLGTSNDKTKFKYKNIYDGYIFLQKMYFFNITDYVLKIKKNVFDKKIILTLDDLPQLHIDKTIMPKSIKLEDILLNQENITSWKIISGILKVHKKQFIFCIFSLIFFQNVQIVANIGIQQIISSFISMNSDLTLKWATGVLGLRLIYHFFLSHCWDQMIILNTQIRLEIIQVLYSKICSLSSHQIQKANLGKLVNIIANDMNSLENKFMFLFFVAALPFFLTFSIYVLWTRCGAFSLLGVGVLFLCVPIQNLLSKSNMKYFKLRNQSSDERIRFTNEVIEGIRLIKMYGWENAFNQMIDNIRSKESFAISRIQLAIYLDRSISLNGSFIALCAMFMSYYYSGNSLDLAMVYSSIQLIEFIRLHGIFFVGMGIAIFYELKVILKRIVDIMAIKSNPSQQISSNIDNKDIQSDLHYVSITNYTGFWENQQSDSDQPKPVLKDINLQISNKLIAVIGTVGSGKSSLLQAIINEIPNYQGEIIVKGNLAITEQEPFIFSGTVQSNILFGKPMEYEKYNLIIKICQLEQDFEQFEAGDMTEIGEKGINLSGGQKARICVARAVYSDADIYLFDDPLSALDAKVARRIFEDVILKYLKGKTVILVTHQLQFLDQVDSIITLMNGQIQSDTSLNSIKEQIDQIQLSRKQSVDQDNQQEQLLKNCQNSKRGKLLVDENSSNTKTNLQTYLKYLKSAKSPIAIIMVIVFHFLNEMMQFFLFRLFGYVDGRQYNPEEVLWIIFIISILFGVIACIKYITTYIILLRANKHIHYNMLKGILRSPQEFFDRNSTGIIVNRFSNDLSIMDNILIFTVVDAIELSFRLLGLAITIIILAPIFVVVSVFLFFSYYIILRIYGTAIRDLKRLDLVNKGPIFSFFSATISGAATIRAFKQQKYFKSKFENIIENYARCNYTYWGVCRAFACQTELTANVFTYIGIIICIYFVDDVGYFSQNVVYLVIMSEFIQWTMRQYLTLDTYFNSVSRTLEYVELQSEGNFDTPPPSIGDNKDNNKLSNKIQWPVQGKIEFKNVKMRYRKESELVLKGLNFNIEGSQKIGVIGRTGAGKSSIIQCIFRMINIEDNGSIMIDGVNIHDVGLHTLRQNISIIPQNPFIFSGTIRRNLDPLSQFSDEQIWEVLKQISLKDYVESLEKQLYTDMTLSQSVFSVGQKQLVCLGRAILKQNKILLLDEATANVDLKTDEFIQNQIKTNFKDCTIITIAHRILTIADYDKIIVMDKGVVVEYDSPLNLLVQNEEDDSITSNGYLAEMVRATGQQTSSLILQIAKQKYFQNQ